MKGKFPSLLVWLVILSMVASTVRPPLPNNPKPRHPQRPQRKLQTWDGLSTALAWCFRRTQLPWTSR
jgi:hypothetical protein